MTEVDVVNVSSQDESQQKQQKQQMQHLFLREMGWLYILYYIISIVVELIYKKRHLSRFRLLLLLLLLTLVAH